MKNNSKRVPAAGGDPAYAVAHVDPVCATCAAHGSLMDGKDYGFPMLEVDDLRTRLKARPLLRQHELTALEITSGLRKQEDDLKREHVLAVKVLVQAIVVIRAVAQEQRRRAGL